MVFNTGAALLDAIVLAVVSKEPEGTYGYKIYIGGRWGKKVSKGRSLSKIFTSKEEALDVIEKAILFFRDNGIKGERFAETIERIGFENVEKELLA